MEEPEMSLNENCATLKECDPGRSIILLDDMLCGNTLSEEFDWSNYVEVLNHNSHMCLNR